ncbi:hypothetical protein EXIGLDRAFT_458629 [Exidia glandulosa HHB12029]|uniref:Uncharacterized protein n=1 Tax=Exidia glandulosa HHB12029 TaxID=1314781 RepID=A0A165PPL3_EXIGL|nr:hypothetical protein EXIGLDRAFT_458629 [Exidia glandulosa HHB12029]
MFMATCVIAEACLSVDGFRRRRLVLLFSCRRIPVHSAVTRAWICLLRAWSMSVVRYMHTHHRPLRSNVLRTYACAFGPPDDLFLSIPPLSARAIRVRRQCACARPHMATLERSASTQSGFASAQFGGAFRPYSDDIFTWKIVRNPARVCLGMLSTPSIIYNGYSSFLAALDVLSHSLSSGSPEIDILTALGISLDLRLSTEVAPEVIQQCTVHRGGHPSSRLESSRGTFRCRRRPCSLKFHCRSPSHRANSGRSPRAAKRVILRPCRSASADLGYSFSHWVALSVPRRPTASKHRLGERGSPQQAWTRGSWALRTRSRRE